jgi:thiamine-phosphate pyrophosphorylase
MTATPTPRSAPTPVARRLADARLYLCTGARRETGDLAQFLDAVLGGGVDLVQLREKGMEAAEEIALTEVVAAAVRRHGALLATNDRADVALAVGADVLHLGQGDLPPRHARAVTPALIGRSTHDEAQAAAADADPLVAYFCTGPVWATPTKPGRPAVGLGLVRWAAAHARTPWFAIGGIESPDRCREVVAAGASRVVVVRALTQAADPGAAARALRRALPP